MRRHVGTTANLVLVFCACALSAHASGGWEHQLHSYQLPPREAPANPKLDMSLNSVLQSSDRLSEASRLGFRTMGRCQMRHPRLSRFSMSRRKQQSKF